MPYLTPAQLSASLKKGELYPVYLLFGKENYLSREYLHQIIRKAVPKEAETFNLQRFDGRELDLTALTIACEGMPMMADRRCVVLSEPNLEKLKKEDAAALLALAEDPNPACVLILYISAYPLTLKKAPKTVQKLADEIARTGGVVEFAPLYQGELIKYLKARCQKAGVTLETPVANALLERCGSSLETLIPETDKLIAYKGEGTLTRQEVEAVTHKSLEASVFKLSGFLLKGRSTQAFSLLEDLFALREQPLAILGALNAAFLDLYRAKAALQSGKGEKELLALFPSYRGKTFRVENALRDAARPSMEDLHRCLFLLSQADLQLKSARCDERVVVEQVLAGILSLFAKGGSR